MVEVDIDQALARLTEQQPEPADLDVLGADSERARLEEVADLLLGRVGRAAPLGPGGALGPLSDRDGDPAAPLGFQRG